jgi:hypothetical protein
MQNQGNTLQYAPEILAFLGHAEFSEIRTRLSREIQRIIDDPAQTERISSESGVTVPNLNSAHTEFAQVDPRVFKIDQNGRALVALLTAPKLSGMWTEFTTRVAQLATDQRVIGEIARSSKIGEKQLRDFGENVQSLVGQSATRVSR